MVMNLVLAIGIMIIAGFFAGKLAHKFKFPMISGYIVVGILLSPSVLKVISSTSIKDLDVFTSIALGIIAYSVGGSLHWASIRKQERSIILIGLLQAVGAWLLSLLAVALIAPFFLDTPDTTFTNTYLPMGLVIGALASATAPAVILAIIREYKAKGSLTTTLLSVVAFDDAIAIILFSIALGIGRPLSLGESASAYQTFLLPLLRILGSVVLGLILGFALIYIARLVRARSLLLVVVLGSIMLCVGLTELLHMSEILANMVIGFIVVNKGKREAMLNVIDDIEDVIFAMFFVLAGLHFNLDVMEKAGLLALLIILSRFSGKYVGTKTGAILSRAPESVKKYLGLALLPAAGVSVGLGLLAQSEFPAFGDLIYNGILTSVIINGLIAPPLVKYAVFKSGEQGKLTSGHIQAKH
jgi:NhaP-type Na+/H+ or K+/H+ antiporter